jgi:hypothetical protein
MQELAEELAKTRLEIVAIQEVRWSGNGVVNTFTAGYLNAQRR